MKPIMTVSIMRSTDTQQPNNFNEINISTVHMLHANNVHIKNVILTTSVIILFAYSSVKFM